MGDWYIEALKTVLYPGSVAVIGASRRFGKWGQLISTNILAGGFGGSVYLVNPRESSMFGMPCYGNVKDIPGKVDTAFITVPAELVMGVLRDCAEKGITGVVMITSGFGETGEEGQALQREVVEFCERNRLILIGPNTMGFMSPYVQLFATGPHFRPKKGKIAFVSQSGNLGNQLIYWATQQGIGVSLFVGSGNEAMLNYRHYLRFLEREPNTEIIVLYIENIGDGKEFLEIAKGITPYKPIILLKGGRTLAGGRAASTHTGAMAGENRVFSHACKQAGVILVDVSSELLQVSAAFTALPLPKGNKVGIVTLGGGWGVVTADLCEQAGLILPPLKKETVDEISKYLPPFWSKANPVDLVGSRDPDVPIVAVEELLKSPEIDAVITLGIVGRAEVVDFLVDSTRKTDKETPDTFLKRVQEFAREYEEMYSGKMVELMERYEKPVLGVTLTTTERGILKEFQGSRYSALFYQTPEQAVNALSKLLAYKRYAKR